MQAEAGKEKEARDGRALETIGFAPQDGMWTPCPVPGKFHPFIHPSVCPSIYPSVHLPSIPSDLSLPDHPPWAGDTGVNKMT